MNRLKDRVSALVFGLLLNESPALKIGLSVFITGMAIIAAICIIAAWFLLSPLWFFLCVGVLFAGVGGYIVNREMKSNV